MWKAILGGLLLALFLFSCTRYQTKSRHEQIQSEYQKYLQTREDLRELVVSGMLTPKEAAVVEFNAYQDYIASEEGKQLRQ